MKTFLNLINYFLNWIDNLFKWRDNFIKLSDCFLKWSEFLFKLKCLFFKYNAQIFKSSVKCVVHFNWLPQNVHSKNCLRLFKFNDIYYIYFNFSHSNLTLNQERWTKRFSCTYLNVFLTQTAYLNPGVLQNLIEDKCL